MVNAVDSIVEKTQKKHVTSTRVDYGIKPR